MVGCMHVATMLRWSIELIQLILFMPWLFILCYKFFDIDDEKRGGAAIAPRTSSFVLGHSSIPLVVCKFCIEPATPNCCQQIKVIIS